MTIFTFRMLRSSNRWWWLTMLLAIGVGAELVLEDASPGSPVRRLAASTLESRPPATAALWTSIDNVLRRLPSGGNVLLQFAGFDSDDPASQQQAGAIYFRSVYLLHPRQVTLAPPDVTVNTGRQVLEAGFHPDSSWIAGHDVRCILRFRRDRGRIAIDVEPISPAGGREERR